MSMILDASAFLALMLGEGELPFREALQQHLLSSGAYVPSLWWYEVCNSLLVGVRRKRYDLSFAKAVLGNAQNYLISQDKRNVSYLSADLLDLAENYKLTVYDASYLEPALEKDAILATLDRALARAAAEAGVALLQT